MWVLKFDMISFLIYVILAFLAGKSFFAIDMDILITITFCIAHTNLSKDQGIKCMSIDVWHDPFWFTSSSYSLRVNFFSNLHRHSNCSYFFVLPTQISKRSMVIWHFPKKILRIWFWLKIFWNSYFLRYLDQIIGFEPLHL